MAHLNSPHHRHYSLVALLLLAFAFFSRPTVATPTSLTKADVFTRDDCRAILSPQRLLPLLKDVIALENLQDGSTERNAEFVEQHVFGFFQTKYGSGYKLVIEEDLDNEVFEKAPIGSVKFARGEARQVYDFVVLVKVSGNSEQALKCVLVSNITQQYTGIVRVDSPVETRKQPRDGKDDEEIECNDNFVRVDIVVFVKLQYVLQLGETSIVSKNLDISFAPGVSFETYHMKLRTQLGSIAGSVMSGFTAHELHVSTGVGDITGEWSLPSVIDFSTERGNIDIDVIPKMWSAGPGTWGDLSASSGTGDIDIRMPFAENKLSLRNGTTRIRARNINAELVHSFNTILDARENINATLLPYWAFYKFGGGPPEHNYITSSSAHGNTSLTVLSPVIDDWYEVNPLHFLSSRHVQFAGTMSLTYPGEWGGVASGVVGTGRHGRVNITGEDFEEVHRAAEKVEVRRPPHQESALSFEIQSGYAELRLRGCENWDCVGEAPGRKPEPDH